MNYTELVQQVKDYLETDETTFNDNIDQFIKNAEEDIYRRVPTLSTRKNATTTFATGDPYLATPSDFLSVYDISYQWNTTLNPSVYTYTTLLRKDVSFIRECNGTVPVNDKPKYYAMFDHNSIIVTPPPDSVWAVQLNYYGKPDSIITASTTWLGDNAENALLFGTVLQGYIFLKGSADMMTVYKASYDQAINNLQILTDGFNKKDEYRHGSRRIPA